MNESIIKSIEDLRPYADSMIRKCQFAKAPSIYHLNLEQKWSYEPEGIWYSLWQNNTLLYICNNLPFIQYNKPRIVWATLDVLVADEIMQPFLLFVNNKFVKWSEVLIIMDRKYSYIMINNTEYDTAQIDCILLPVTVRYREDTSLINISGSNHFVFNSNNDYVDSPADPTDTYTVIDFDLNDDIFYETFELKEGQKQLCSLDSKWKITEDNIILFQKGLLYNGNIKLHGLNIFSVDNNIFSDTTIAKIFYFKGNESKDNIQFVKNKSYLKNKIMNSSTDIDYINRLNIPFDIFFHQFWNYNANITNALRCIMMYNSSLLDSVYERKSNIIPRTYTGKRLKELQDINHNITLSRKIGDSLENYPIIFYNGELYKYNHLIQYKNKDFIFPLIDNVKDNDIFEILYFTNIDNRVYKIFLNSGNQTKEHYIINAMDSENIKLFSEDLPSMEYAISRTNKVQFEIAHHSQKIDQDHITIAPDNPFYYDKEISLVSRKQFHHIYRKIKDDTIFIKLPEEFVYCNNPNNYLVFINHRKIDRENYKITIPDSTKPFDDICIFTNIPLYTDDEIEIFYIGYDMEETTMQPSIPLNGDVFLNRELLGYGFNKYLYLIFINGKKVKSDDIENIDSKRLRIINNQNTVENLTVVKHIADEEELKNIFDLNQDEITNIMDSISTDEINNLYPIESLSLNEESNIKQNKVNTKLILYEIIRKYWMRPGNMQKLDPFLYSYDNPELFDKDSKGNLLSPMDALNNNYFKNDNINN